MDPRTFAMGLHRESFNWMWSVMESLQRQNETLVWNWINTSPVPIGHRTRNHTQKWMSLFQKSCEDARDTGRSLLGQLESRITR
ncbi:hypothetical protein [Desulfobotulus sp.]|uniref:hypothetical protein n=1 Tax=Desulfobotulus sp. TaxID=1940337 RepID=UPI002A359576|nr:hypothetical protein [Desulfobotulus sp.]MDY0161677.1 hypothetical protein [Desulfobotulus sp.]